MKFQIFVEGKADKKFIQDYYYSLNGSKLEDEYIKKIGGLGELKKFDNAFKTNTIQGIKTVIILDADLNPEKRKIDIQKLINELSIDAKFFLIPNHLDKGNLEDLLQKIINPLNKELFECWDSYIDCLNSKDKNYTTPNYKAKIFAYLEALLDEKESEQIHIEKRNYLESKHWDLNSDYLKPLKEFLTTI